MARILLCLLMICTGWAASAEVRRPSHCIALAQGIGGDARLFKASFSDPVAPFTVRITYVDHSMFVLQTPGGLSAVTDYAGYLGDQDFVPDVATMNHGHSSHWTARPDPRITHVLPGWADEGGGVEHYLDLGEMLVRNVSTDIRSRFGDGVEVRGNSIFVFEVEGLCIGHLGHLHHEPTPEQYAALGRLDVVFVPVDGGMTLPLPAVMNVISRLRSSVIIPMHWFGRGTLDAFLVGLKDDFAIMRPADNHFDVSLRSLPNRPTIVVLEPRFLRSFDND